jgi:hypothetical protein
MVYIMILLVTKIVVFRDVTPFSLVGWYHYFRGSCLVSTMRVETACSSRMLVPVHYTASDPNVHVRENLRCHAVGTSYCAAVNHGIVCE